jgi:hypothetical protein
VVAFVGADIPIPPPAVPTDVELVELIDSLPPPLDTTMVLIVPGQHSQAVIDSHPPGTTFLLQSGMHRMQTIAPRVGDTFQGEPGSIISGAKLLTEFVRDSVYWVAENQTQQRAQHGGPCMGGFPRCGYTEDLFIDNVPLLHVDSLHKVGPGSYFFDYPADRIYFIDDPTGRVVETTVLRHAFQNTADSVTIRGLIVEKFGPPAQDGAIRGMYNTGASMRYGWLVENNEVRFNHGTGIRMSDRARVLNNYVHTNGQQGIAGGGRGSLVEGNEIAYNNYANYSYGWEAGCCKFVWSDSLIVRDNYVHDNNGSGIWLDINNINSLIEDNVVENHPKGGIHHEISYAAVIRNNISRNNSWDRQGWIGGCGIIVAGSPNVEIYGNTIEDNYGGICANQQDRGSGAYGPYETRNLYVHDNHVTFRAGGNGLVVDYAPADGALAPWESWNNRFENNTYVIGGTGKRFAWMGNWRTDEEWLAYGQDTTGTITRVP